MEAQNIQTLETTLNMLTWQEPVIPHFPERPSPTFPQVPTDYGQPFGYGPTFYLGGANIIDTPTGFIIPLPDARRDTPLRDVHETFRIDPVKGPTYGHTTFDIGGGNKIRHYYDMKRPLN